MSSTLTAFVLGRLASQVARLLRGKHKAVFAPHVDTGDSSSSSTRPKSH